MTFGRGDAILRYPELIEGYTTDCVRARQRVEAMRPYVAVHLTASEPRKMPPKSELLIAMLRGADIPFVLVGEPTEQLPMHFRLHADIVREAHRFIGTLSVFNCVAQVSHVPSFVLVNRALKEPLIYARMWTNRAHIREWNVGIPIEQIYGEAVTWAKS